MRSLTRFIALVLITGFVASAPPPLGAATTDTFLDEFNNQLYSNNDGTALWAGDWTESESPQDPIAGTISVQSDGAEDFALLFADAAVGDYVERTADLAAFDAATLTFDYRQHFMTPSVGFEVQVSEDGSSWDSVWSMWGSGSDGSYLPVSVDLSGYSATSTIVRFIHTAGTPAGFIFHIDNVQIAEATPANQPPAAVDDDGSTAPNTPVTIDVLANDTDADLDVLSVDTVTQGSNGSVVNNGTDVTYTPNPGWRGLDTFTYTAADGNGGFDTATVTVGVGGVCYVVGDGGGADSLTQVNLGSGLETLVGSTGTSGITAAALHPLTGTLYASLPGRLGTIDVLTGVFSPTAGPFGGGYDNIQAIAFDTDGSLYAFHHRAGPKDLLIRVDPSTGAFIPDAFGPGVDSVALDSHWATQKSVVGIDINDYGHMYGVTSNDGLDYTIQWIDKNSGSAFVVWGASATADVSLDATGRFWMLSPTGTLREPFGTSMVLSELAGYQAVACEGGLANQSPSANGDAASTAEDVSVIVNVLGNDSDADLDPLAVDAVTDGLNGSVVNNVTNVTYTPNPDWNGIDTFSYTVSDGKGGFASAQVTVTVTAQPDPPVAVDDADLTVEDTPVTVDVLANDSDVDLDVLSVSAVTQGSDGSVVNNGTDVTYTPNPGWSGTDTFTYTVSDGNGGTDTATVTITVSPVNDDPVAVDDPDVAVDPVYYMVRKASSRSLDVLFNDTDPEGDPLTVISAGPGINGGTATVAGDGLSVTYAPPDPSFVGADTFTYTISDGNGGTGAGSVDVVVVEKLADVSAESMATDPAVPSQGSPFDLVVVSKNLGPDSATNTQITFQLTPALAYVSGAADNGTCSEMPPGSGTIVCTHGNPPGDGTPRVATVTVTSSASGPHTVMAAVDSDDIDPEPSNNLVQLTFGTANSAPDAVDDAAGTPEDTAVAVDVLANDSDSDLDPLTVDSITQGSNGSVANNGSNVTYDPDPDWNGIDTFTYTVSDGNGGFATATVTVTVTPANDPPVAVDDADLTVEDTPVTVDVLANDSDVDLDVLSVSAVTQGSDGSVVNNGTDVTYTPNPGWSGTDTFTYTVSDGNGGTDDATVTVTVGPVNDDPVAVDDTDTTAEDTAVTVDVLANDSDPELDPLTVDSVTQGTHGAVTTDGSTVTYTPNADWYGVDTFTYTVADGNGGFASAQVTVTVTPVNDDPVAVDDTKTVTEDSSHTIPVLGNDSDPDGHPLTVSGVIDGTNGTVTNNGTDVTYTPNPDWSGTDTFMYTVSDGNGGSASALVTVTVTPVNDDPQGQPDATTTPEDTPITIDVLANDTDVDSVVLTITAVGDGAHGTVTTDGLIVTYTPDPDWNGTDTFTYRVTDDLGGWSETDVTVTVTPVNDDPVAVDDTETTPKDTGVEVWVLANDSDVDLDTLSVSAFTAPSHGSVVNHSVKVTYTPDPGWTGTDAFSYTVFDGNGGFDLATVTVEVTAGPNQPPVANDDGTVTNEDVAITVAVLANDSDPDRDPLTVESVNQGAHGSVTKTSTTVTYTPDKDWSGIDSFSYTIGDGSGLTATAAVVITVKPVNDPPNARDDNVTITGPSAVTVSVLANDTDVDGDRLRLATVSPGSNGVTTTDGFTVTYTPSPGWAGTDSFTYTIIDGKGGSDSAFVVVTVELPSQPPVIVVTGDSETGDSDPLPPDVPGPDGDEFFISESDIPDGLNLIDEGDGDTAMTGTPDVRPPELTHQIYEIEGADALLATGLTANVATPSPPNVRLTPREGLMVAFGSAVETLKSQIVPALILGVVMAWMLMIGVGRVKEEEEET